MKLLAKSKQNERLITLQEHTKAVINVTHYTLQQIIDEKSRWFINKFSTKELYNGILSAAALHDIGKCTDIFQSYLEGEKQKIEYISSEDGLEPLIKKRKGDFHATHNMFSWAYALRYTNLSKHEWALSAVLYHHIVYSHLSELGVNDILNKLSDQEKERFDSFLLDMKEYLLDRFEVNLEYDERDSDRNEKVSGITLHHAISFRQDLRNKREEIERNMRYLLSRSILIFADRLVSSYPEYSDSFAEYDIELIEKLYNEKIKAEHLPNDDYNVWAFDSEGNEVYDIERLQGQNELMDRICEQNNCVIPASAGFGKTLIGIRWILRNKKKTLWVTPRNVIAESTYISIVSELEKMEFSNKITTGLLLHGDYIQGDENCDILVTNIDNFLSMMVKNNMAHNLVKEIGGNVIFDEFHEFLCTAPLYPAFITYGYTRINWTKSKTLFLSATAIPFHEVFEWEDVKVVKPSSSYNGDMKVNIKILELDDIRDLQVPNKDSFVITNTVRNAQEIYRGVREERNDSVLIHSQFPTSRRNEIEKTLYLMHGKKSNLGKRNTIIGTNIIGVGLDISAQNIYDFVINPEGTIQRGCGRGGRFREYDSINYYVCSIPGDRGSKKFITQTYNTELYRLWYNELAKLDGKTITKDDLYVIYSKFYADNKIEIRRLIYDWFIKGAEYLTYFKPYSAKKVKDGREKKLTNGLTYRGDNSSIYVVAKDSDGNICEPVTIDLNNLREKEKEDKEAKKCHYNAYKNMNIENFKRKFKDYNYRYQELWKYALDYDTPLLLYYAEYDKDLGLMLN